MGVTDASFQDDNGVEVCKAWGFVALAPHDDAGPDDYKRFVAAVPTDAVGRLVGMRRVLIVNEATHYIAHSITRSPDPDAGVGYVWVRGIAVIDVPSSKPDK